MRRSLYSYDAVSLLRGLSLFWEYPRKRVGMEIRLVGGEIETSKAPTQEKYFKALVVPNAMIFSLNLLRVALSGSGNKNGDPPVVYFPFYRRNRLAK